LNQGVKDQAFVAFLNELERTDQRIKVIHEAENIGINDGCKKCAGLCRGDLIIKLDDDMLIVSDDFLENLLAACNAMAEPVVLSPFPVGIVGFTGGVAGRYGHSIYYARELDVYYAIRWVHYAGGCCLVMPRIAIEKAAPFDDFHGAKGASEHDAVIAGKFRKAGFRIGYMENACVVEHQESTIGQWARSGAFKVNKRKTGWVISLDQGK
jgi:GT2 family glycosyltransferase